MEIINNVSIVVGLFIILYSSLKPLVLYKGITEGKIIKKSRSVSSYPNPGWISYKYVIIYKIDGREHFYKGRLGSDFKDKRVIIRYNLEKPKKCKWQAEINKNFLFGSFLIIVGIYLYSSPYIRDWLYQLLVK